MKTHNYLPKYDPLPTDVTTVLIHKETNMYRWFVGVNAFIRAKNSYYAARLNEETVYPWMLYVQTNWGLAKIARPHEGPESYQ